MSAQTARFGALLTQQLPSYGQQYYSHQGFAGMAGAGYGGCAPPKAALPVDLSGSLLPGMPSKRPPFAVGQRRRINVVPLLLCLLLPWALFVLDFWVTSFSVRYDFPYVFYVVLACSTLVVLMLTWMAVAPRLRLFVVVEREPSWIIFLAVTTAAALVLGYVLGDRNFSSYTRPYYDFHSLNLYSDINPVQMRGQQLMDAGALQFVEGSRLDISRSMGFKHGSVYCVAPIVLGNSTSQTLDFWAVGTGCCSGSQADFHCKGHGIAHGGGLRLLGGGREYYRLAVQQAEATYGIRAPHPLFFTWVERPLVLIEEWQASARTAFVISMFSYLLVQAFLVVAAALAFTKLGHI